jgi:anti-anti-sigma factor
MAGASALPFQYEIEVSGDTTVIKCHGRVVSDTAGDLKQLVKPMIPKCRRIVLDLTDIDHIDSSGLGTLVGLKISAGAAAYCRLEFINFSPRVKELLHMTKLNQMLES